MVGISRPLSPYHRCNVWRTAGYLGGKVDNVMMRIVDVLYIAAIHDDRHRAPGLLSVALTDGTTLSSFIALGSVSWLTSENRARQVHVVENQNSYSQRGRTVVKTRKIIFKHLVPNALGPVIAYSTLTVPAVMLQEAFLSFLGLGVQAPLASWGSLANEGIQNIAIFPWQLIFPGVTMALALFSLNFLGDGLRDALDPQSGVLKSDK